MLKVALFCFFTPFALMEFFYYHQFGIALVGTLYLILSVQADMAANKLMAQSANSSGTPRKRWNEYDGDEEEEEIKVAPLGEKRREERNYQPPPPQAAPAPRAEPPPKAQPKPQPAELPKAPNFRGRAHEILGIPENAATRTIINAFRHLIKRVHPDHKIDGQPMQIANLNAIRVTEAKRLLLERRRKKTAA